MIVCVATGHTEIHWLRAECNVRSHQDGRGETMTAEVATVRIEITNAKPMTEILKRYHVRMRSGPKSVTHRAYGTKTLVSPSVYAVYEAAVKANYVATFLSLYPDIAETLGCMAYFQGLIADNVQLPWISEQMLKDKDKVIAEASQDYNRCSRAIAEAGLYMQLLD